MKSSIILKDTQRKKRQKVEKSQKCLLEVKETYILMKCQHKRPYLLIVLKDIRRKNH